MICIKLGIVSAGFCKANAYYLVNYGQGIVVLTISDERIKAKQKDEAAAVLTHFPNVISYFEMNHKNAFTSYLAEKKFSMGKSKQHHHRHSAGRYDNRFV